MVTLRDIAKEVNVSIPVVSKVLNNSQGTTGVSIKTAERIRQTAARLGYRRNRSAAALRMGRHNILGVLIHRAGAIDSGLTEATLTGVARAAAECGQQLELAFYETDGQFRQALARMNPSMVDGLIVAGVSHPGLAEDLLGVRAAGAPVVTVFARPIHPRVPNVGCDGVEIARVATAHLIERGCRRIAHLYAFDDRYDGYRKALAEAGIPLREELIVDVRNPEEIRFEDGLRGAERLLDSGVAFDGVFAFCDLHAAAVLRVFTRRGVRVGEDVKLIGVDDAPWCPHGVVALSSVSVSLLERADKAVEMVMKARESDAVPSITVAPSLRARESTLG